MVEAQRDPNYCKIICWLQSMEISSLYFWAYLAKVVINFFPGHFLLTLLLLDDLKTTAAQGGEARIVVTASSTHDPKGRSKL